MALVVKDRVRETSTSSGTGDLILNGAVQAFQDFSVIGDGNTTYYTIVDATTGAWEVGLGTYTLSTTTLSRDTVLESSDGGTAVNFAANTKDVFVTYPAERSVYVDGGAISPATAARLGFSNLAQGAGLSVLGVTGASTANVASIAAGTDHQVFRRSGSAVSFGPVALDQSAAVAGLLPVVRGGSGAGTLTGYLQGNGTAAFTASATIPNTDITGLGTMSTQNANNVNIDGGAIDGTVIGGTTASTGTFSSLTATTADINGGSIDGATIGAAVASTGAFTTLTSSSTTTLNGTTIPASKTLVDTDSSQTITNKAYNGSIGATTPSTGDFTNFTASGTASFTSTQAVKLPVGTQAQRPTPTAGMLRFNDDLDEFEGYNGTAWASVGGSAISNDTTTATNLFPTFVDATTGTAADIFTSNDKLLYKPSTGEFKSPALVATNGIVLNAQVITENSVIPTGFNAGSVGPVEIAAGVDVDIADGSEWYIA